LLYAGWAAFVPDTLEQSAGEVTVFLISEQLASMPGDLV